MRRLKRCLCLAPDDRAVFLGSGASGEVWRVERGTERRVFKLFRHSSECEFVHELRMAKWAQRYLPQYCVGFTAAKMVLGGRYCVAELPMEGVDLWLVCAQNGAWPSPDQTLTWIVQMVHAVDAMHRCGMYHNDIKPENVLIGADGRARFLDFAFASRGDVARSPRSAYGSPGYLHPSLRCTSSLYTHTVTTDVYALMRTVAFLLSGHGPTLMPWVGGVVEAHLRRAEAFPRRAAPREWAARLSACCRADRRGLAAGRRHPSRVRGVQSLPRSVSHPGTWNQRATSAWAKAEPPAVVQEHSC